MATLHFLNVKQGDCSVVCHKSGHTTVIDVCNAKYPEDAGEEFRSVFSQFDRGVSGNFQQKKYPVNPINYLRKLGIESVFRYIQTHPDMDHMDGIKDLFTQFSPINFWDTNNTKEMDESSWGNSPYNEDDWLYYKGLRDSNPDDNPKRLTPLAGDEGMYWNKGKYDGEGDGLDILAPSKELVDSANENDDDYNDCSYVLLQRLGSNRIVYGGDSHDDTWSYILENYHEDVRNIDLLIAPHHGRDSGRSYEFLNVLNPILTFFGNARSEHLAYSAWNNRGLAFITNNQANCMIVDVSKAPMVLYVTHENYAKRVNPDSYYEESYNAWYVGDITRDLLP